MLYSCEKNSTGSESESQIMFVYAYHENYYWDDVTDEEIDVKNTTAWGVVLGDPLPGFEYIKLGNTTFSGSNYCNYYPGYVSIEDFGDEGDLMITSNYDPLNVEVKTSLGKVSGTITIPDTLTSISVSDDTLQLGEPFTISWSGGNADFYSVYCDYEWKDNNDNSHYTYLDTFVTGSSVTYPGTIFIHDGEIDWISIYPYNGPLPKEGVEGNMIGEGSGFLYYENEEQEDDYDYEVVIGMGLSKTLGKTSSLKYSRKEIRDRTIKKIEKIIGLPYIEN